ncbi:hypothetical protein V8E53_007759 [Lactarius tabidus]
MALRYLNSEKATAETFVDGYNTESCAPKVLRRWVRTGDDSVLIDKNNDLFIVDVDRLKVRGFQVASAELEGYLLSHPDVAGTCVVGVPDDFSGEVPLAFALLSADAAKRASASEAATAKILNCVQEVGSCVLI